MTKEERKAKIQSIREYVSFLSNGGITVVYVEELQFLLSEINRLETIEEMEGGKMNNNARDIINRLEGSLKYDAINGSEESRAIFESQVQEAIKVLKYLSGRDAVLSKLEAAGVDNWEGYDDALNGHDDL